MCVVSRGPGGGHKHSRVLGGKGKLETRPEAGEGGPEDGDSQRPMENRYDHGLVWKEQGAEESTGSQVPGRPQAGPAPGSWWVTFAWVAEIFARDLAEPAQDPTVSLGLRQGGQESWCIQRAFQEEAAGFGRAEALPGAPDQAGGC